MHLHHIANGWLKICQLDTFLPTPALRILLISQKSLIIVIFNMVVYIIIINLAFWRILHFALFVAPKCKIKKTKFAPRSVKSAKWPEKSAKSHFAPRSVKKTKWPEKVQNAKSCDKTSQNTIKIRLMP